MKLLKTLSIVLLAALARHAGATEYMLSGPVLAVSGATTASPIAVTSATHSYVTGDVVRISGVQGIQCANGDWSVTVTGATTFTLDNSVGVGCGTYSGGANDTVQVLGARGNVTGPWFDLPGGSYARVYVYGSAAVTGTVAIQAAPNPYAFGTPVNVPTVAILNIPNPPVTTSSGQVTSSTVTYGRVRAAVTGWTVGTAYAVIEAYAADGRRIW